MTRFLIDVNHPYWLSLWRGDGFVHQRDINPEMPDKEIWEFAQAHNYTIVTKDADFADRILSQTPPPRVIQFKTGNMKLDTFYNFIQKNWKEIAELSMQCKLVNVFNERIEGVE